MDITAYITAILQFSMLGSSHRFSGERPRSVFTERDWEALGFVDGLELAGFQLEL
jgi:hypothetical protein